MNYQDFAKLPASEKVVLCIAQARTQFKVFANEGGSVYSKIVPYFVHSVIVNGTVYTSVNATPAAGQFRYDIKNKKLYIRTTDSSDPKTKQVVVIYKFFFATAPHILPYDLNSGEYVEFDARVEKIGSLGQQLDDENTGIVLESSSSIELQNNDGYFDDIFDTLIWENQDIEFYSWSPKIPITEAVRLFSGVVESKSSTEAKIQFSVKDFVYRLKNKVNLANFSESDGKIADSMLGKPKRRLYGQFKQVGTVGVDNILDGYALTGTITVSINSTALVGTGTQFLSQLSPQDQLFLTLDDGTVEKITIESITDDTNAVLSDEADFAVTTKPATVKPQIPYRMKNRKWHLAGHPLVAPVSTIVFPITSRKFLVDSVDDMYAGDSVTINGNVVRILRISGLYIITDQAIDPVPDIGDTIEKSPVSRVYFGSQELLKDRDWTLTNFPDAIINIDPLAERNLAPSRNITVNLVFTSGSRTVTVATGQTVDLRTILKPRDWIRKNKVTENVWYEVLDVRELTITLRTNFAGASETFSAKMKNVEMISDDSIITVDCIGKRTSTGPYRWLKTPSDIVRDLILNDAGFSSVDEASFAQAKADCNYVMSLAIPDSIGDEAPTVRDTITKINESVFGSLYGNKSMAISYSILNAKKPTDLTVIKDDDILGWSSVTEQKIVNKVKVNYRPFIDLYTGMNATETLEYTNDFVDKFVGIQNTEERTIYLYETDKALIVAQRIAFFKSLSNCKITLRGKLNLALTAVNDKMYLEFDRLFKRYGGYDTKKIGIVTGVKKNGFEVDVELTDLGNIFNRVPVIAPNTTHSYSTATRDDAVKYGFVVDNNTLTPDNTSEIDLGNNRIG